jgi:hypothetical protein
MDNITNYRVYKVTKIVYASGTTVIYSEENSVAAVYQKSTLLNMLDNIDTEDGIYNDHG